MLTARFSVRGGIEGCGLPVDPGAGSGDRSVPGADAGHHRGPVPGVGPVGRAPAMITSMSMNSSLEQRISCRKEDRTGRDSGKYGYVPCR